MKRRSAISRMSAAAAVVALLGLSGPNIAARTAALPERLKTFAAFVEALESGRTVRVVIRYAKFRMVVDGKEEKAPDAVGGMELGTFEYFAPGAVKNPKGFVSASETVLISHPRYGYVQNHVKLRVFEDGTAEVTARYLEPGTLKVVMDETFFGAIDDGTNGGGLALFSGDGPPGGPFAAR